MNTSSTSPSLYRHLFALGLCGALTVAAPSRADVISDWNRAGIEARSAQTDDSYAETMATLNIAMFEALNYVSGRYRSTYLVHHQGFTNVSGEAAAAAAAHQVLSLAYPEQKTRFDGLLAATLAELPANNARASGVVAGQSVAAVIQAARPRAQRR